MTADSATTEREIERISREWMDAVPRRDREALERYLADEFVLTSNQGLRMDRATWLDIALNRVSGAGGYSDVSVRVYGDAAVMLSLWTMTATIDGKDWSGTSFITDVWVKRDDRWQVVTRHSSSVPSAT
jgi:ketosteroid isomerase-like protein